MKTLTLFMFSVLTSNLLVGCGDNGTVDDPAADDSATEEAVPFPRTCAEAAAGNPAVADGEYELFIDGDENKPWTAYCADIASDPKEFLTPQMGNSSNWSSYAAGGRSIGTEVRTRYDKIRIDPITLELDISDQTFAESTGSLAHLGGEQVTSMPLGVAMSCGGGYATAQVDVSDTPFKLMKTFALGGDASVAGHAEPWESGKVIELWADGDCGWIAPSLAPAQPMNKAGDFMIGLTYAK